jgi:hypothetical protein
MNDETEYEIRGFYKPHFFSLFINGDFNSDFTILSKQNLGTFVHEYIHYLQNITTVFGLRNSIFYFHYLYEVKKYVAENDNLILPLKDIKLTDNIIVGKSVFDRYKGTTNSFSPEYDDIKVYLEDNTNNGTEYKIVNIELKLKGLIVGTFVIGNLCVKEGMARLYQLFYDEEVEHPTFPYKTIEILCEILNPEILEDKRKLIALCILALNSQNSALTLYELLIEVRTSPELNGIELYKKYISERWIVQGGKKISIPIFLLQSINEFKQVLSGSIYAELDHFEKMFENIISSVKQNISPILEVLYEDVNNVDKLVSIVDFYGIPHIRTIDGNEYYPLGSKKDCEDESPALEFIDLLGQHIVFERILEFRNDKICSLYPQCALAREDIVNEDCFSTQWKRETSCPFKIVSDNWKLNLKIKSG